MNLFLKDIHEPPSIYSKLFAVRLTSCKANLADEFQKEILLKNKLRTQQMFLSSLYSTEPSKTFDLRIISYPGTSSHLGKIEIILFVKISSSNVEKCDEEARKFVEELLALLNGGLEDYEFEPIYEEDFEKIYNPFEFRYNAEICKRENLISLKNLRRETVLTKGLDYLDWSKEDLVYFVHPLIPFPNSFSRLLRILLNLYYPILISVRASPTSLSKEEIDAINIEIKKCEKIVESKESEALKMRASAISNILEKQLARLLDAPFHLVIQISSPEPFSSHIIESIGIEFTKCPGEDIYRPEDAFYGGYDIFYAATPEENSKFIENLRKLNFEQWRKNLAPPSLKRFKYLFDPLEAISVFHFPIPINDELSGVNVRRTKFVPPPSPILSLEEKNAIHVGISKYMGKTYNVYLSDIDRINHIYCVGQTGTGKTTFLKKMILEDIKNGKGIIVIDPHGDLFKELLQLIPDEREDDLVIFDPCDTQYPVGFNLLECTIEQKYFVAREMRAIMERIIEDQYGRASGDYAGPLFFQHMQMNLLLVMSHKENPGTLLEFYEIYHSEDYWKRWKDIEFDDPHLKRWVTKNLPNINYLERRGGEMTLGEYLSSKFDDFILDPKLRLIFGQKKSTINLREIMDNEKILLINLAKGDLSETNSRFLGMIIMSKILTTAMERINTPPHKRRTCFLYVDEFQSIATDSFVLLLSEARKFGLSLILANQFVSQIKNERIKNSIFGNVGTIISFRVGQEDAKILKDYFLPVFDFDDLTNLPDWHACVKTKVKGEILFPFSLQTIPFNVKPNPEKEKRVRDKSRNRYGTLKEKVEEIIRESLSPYKECS